MPKSQEFTITRDTLLKQLNLPRLERLLPSPRQRERLFEIVAEYIENEALPLAVTQEPREQSGLPARIAGTSFHLRLSMPTAEELKEVTIAAAGLIAATGQADLKAITAAAVMSLRNRLSRARVDYGERSVVDVLMEARASLTADEVLIRLFGQSCRYPRSSCRHQSAARDCTLNSQGLAAVLASLEGRGVLVAEQAVAPTEYRVAF